MNEAPDITEEVTTILPVPVASGYRQDDEMVRLIALLAQLCARPDEFIKRAQEAQR